MKNMCRSLPILCVALALVLMVGVAAAQDVFKINYYANANTAGAPDATLRVDNPGLTYSNVCAMIYVFTADQQMTECCGCVNSHNNLNTLSFNKDLGSNPLTGKPPVTGVVKIVSAAVNGGPCDPTANVTPTANLRAWGTHIQNKVGSSWPITETEFTDSTLGATELANLQAQCAFINILGSGQGICSCGVSK